MASEPRQDQAARIADLEQALRHQRELKGEGEAAAEETKGTLARR
jgi:hypothetical protein